MIKGIQLVGILVASYLLFSTYNNYRKRQIGIKKTALWGAIWLLMALIFYDTNLMNIIMPILTTQDGIQTVMVMGILTSFIFINQVYVKVIELDKKMTGLTQNLAINDYLKEITEEDR